MIIYHECTLIFPGCFAFRQPLPCTDEYLPLQRFRPAIANALALLQLPAPSMRLKEDIHMTAYYVLPTATVPTITWYCVGKYLPTSYILGTHYTTPSTQPENVVDSTDIPHLP